MNEYSVERIRYLNGLKRKKLALTISKVLLLALFLGLWELLCAIGVMDPFITSSPSRVVLCLIELASDGSLFIHLGTSCMEAVIGFIAGTAAGLITAIILWWNEYISAIFEPYLVVLNALPKVALGPIIIVWAGAGIGSIIIMTLAISLIVTILEVHNAFLSTDKEKIMLLKSMGANKRQIFTKVILPANLNTIASSLKVNMGLSWVGVIMGEFLVSKAGLGYLISYGSQVFRMDLVMTSVLLLALAATGMYKLISLIELAVKSKNQQ